LSCHVVVILADKFSSWRIAKLAYCKHAELTYCQAGTLPTGTLPTSTLPSWGIAKLEHCQVCCQAGTLPSWHIVISLSINSIQFLTIIWTHKRKRS